MSFSPSNQPFKDDIELKSDMRNDTLDTRQEYDLKVSPQTKRSVAVFCSGSSCGLTSVCGASERTANQNVFFPLCSRESFICFDSMKTQVMMCEAAKMLLSPVP